MTAGKKYLKFVLKFIIIGLIIYISFYALMLIPFTKTKGYDDITKLDTVTNEVNGASLHIPQYDELGEYKSVNIFHKETKQFIWKIDSLTLKVRYDTDGFENALNNININYSFLKEPKEDMLDYYATIDGYEIQVVDKTEMMQADHSYDYPKCFMMIGVNRQEQTIVYLYHYDFDLDSIDDLDNYIKKYYILE